MSYTDAQFIEACIPDTLRTAGHPDTELVNTMIATALLAYRKSDSVWEKNVCKDINAALSKAYESVYVPHIAKEDEDWNALKSTASEVESLREIAAKVPELEALMPSLQEQASRAMPQASVFKVRKRPNGEVSFAYSGAASGDGFAIPSQSGVWEVSLMDDGNDESETEGTFSGSGKSADSAVRDAFMSRGIAFTGTLGQ